MTRTRWRRLLCLSPDYLARATVGEYLGSRDRTSRPHLRESRGRSRALFPNHSINVELFGEVDPADH